MNTFSGECGACTCTVAVDSAYKLYMLQFCTCVCITSVPLMTLLSLSRPQLLVLTGPPSSRPDLVHFMSHISKEVGVMICGDVVLVSVSPTHSLEQK